MRIFSKFIPSFKATPKQLIGVEDNWAPKDEIFRVEWNLGARCNYDCSYCSPNIHDKKNDFISMDVVEKTVDKIVQHARSQNKEVRIGLTGGEPYLHPQFLEMLALMKNKGISKISVTSNGSMPAATYIESLKYIDHLILSVHFEFAKVSKLKEKIRQIHAALKDPRHMHLHIMAIPSKVREAVELAEEMRELGVSYALRRVRPQFDKDGIYLQPFNSGKQGGHRANWEKIKQSQAAYYSKEELQQLGANV